jgi:hypothetical protein
MVYSGYFIIAWAIWDDMVWNVKKKQCQAEFSLCFVRKLVLYLIKV